MTSDLNDFLCVLGEWQRESTDVTVSAWLSGSCPAQGADGAFTRITGKVTQIDPGSSSCAVVTRDDSVFQLRFANSALARVANSDLAAKYVHPIVDSPEDIGDVFSIVQPSGATICMFSLA